MPAKSINLVMNFDSDLNTSTFDAQKTMEEHSGMQTASFNKNISFFNQTVSVGSTMRGVEAPSHKSKNYVSVKEQKSTGNKRCNLKSQ